MTIKFDPASPQTPDQIIRQNALLLPKTRAAFGRVMGKTGNARILCIGDSTIMGYGSNGGSSPSDQKTLSLPTQLSNMLNAAGINAHANSWFGNGGSRGSPSTTLQWDPRLVAGSSWGVGVNSLGGQSWTATTNTNALSFTPTVPVDTFVVYFVRNSGLGTLSLDIGGAGTTSHSTAGAAGISSATIAGTLGLNTCNVKYVSGSNVYVVGMEAYDSSKNWVSVCNAGWDGSWSTDWAVTTSAWSNANAIPLISPDLTLICLGINDWDNAVAPATYQANVQVPITKALTVGDVMLLTPTPTDPNTNASVATQQGLINAMYNLAAANPIALVDNWARWVSYAVSNPNGLYFDHIHPNAVGYADQAQNVFTMLNAAGENATSETVGTFANAPASASIGQKYVITDFASPIEIMWNGVNWKPPAGKACLYNNAVKDTFHTGDTNETIMRSLTLPASLISLNGSYEVILTGGATGTAAAKNFAAYLAAAATISGFQFLNTASSSNSLGEEIIRLVTNRNVQNSQVSASISNTGIGVSSAANATGTTVTNAIHYLVFTVKLTNGADSAGYDHIQINWIEP